MPVLMIALFALAAFGLIGFLLLAAVLCEPKQANDSGRRKPGAESIRRPA
jgi:hypothetical protein